MAGGARPHAAAHLLLGLRFGEGEPHAGLRTALEADALLGLLLEVANHSAGSKIQRCFGYEVCQ